MKAHQFPKDVEDFYPLSPMQEGMLFHSLYLPDATAYIEQIHCNLRGSFDAVAFEKAWQSVMDRHPVLRTSFTGESLKEPIQLVHRGVMADVHQVDLTRLSSAERQDRLRTIHLEDCTRGFDLSKPPLMRFTLARVGSDTYNFTWTYHHILLDGWSVPMLLEEVFALHHAYRAGRTETLPARRPYRDYIVWLRKQNLATAESYWRKALAGFSTPTPLAIPFAGEGSAMSEGALSVEEHLLSSETSRALSSLAKKLGVTLNTVMQGIWAFLLSRYSGEDDVLFGSTVSGRPPDLAEADKMLGLFINTLPVRVRLPHRTPFSKWLKGVAEQQADMLQFEYTPLVKIQKWSDVKGGTPLFESIFVFENYPVNAAMAEGDGEIEISEIESREETNFPLTVVGGPGDQVLVRIVSATEHFAKESVRSVLNQFETVADQLVAFPDRMIDDFDLLSHGERQRLVVDWNATGKPQAQSLLVHEMIAARAKSTPDAIAVSFGASTLAYGDLNSRANRLALRLRALGVRPEVIVGICLDPSFEMIIAALAVLKAGGAYLPLEPAFPEERLRYMIADSGIRILIANPGLPILQQLSRITVVSVDDHSDKTSETTGDLERWGFPESLAYVIFTSGSTGRPKGSMLVQSGFANLVTKWIREFSMDEQSRVLNFFSFCFDGSIMTIFTTLAAGGTLVLLDREELMSPRELCTALRDLRISHLLLTPSVLSLAPQENLPDLRNIMVGGEACPADVARRWATGRSFVNAYGPTETSVVATHYHTGEDLTAGASVPIGRPLDGVQIYMLDRNLNPVPRGVTGEVFISGVGVGRGYLHQSALTAEKFLPDPFSQKPGVRMYRTGDRARFLSDGNLEFQGRVDDQVKIRGYRIELGEIESIVRQTPGVKEALVIVRDDSVGGGRIVAYVVPDDNVALTKDQLLSRVREFLPAYMIPSAVVTLERLPHLASGKIDRKSLPPPEAMQQEETPTRVPPRDALESKLCEIWEGVLQITPIGVNDNFFELGGHSFLALRLLALIEQEFGKEIPIVSLFQNPTIGEFARLLRDSEETSGGASLIELRKRDSAKAVFFIHPTGGSVHWYTDLAKSISGDIAVYGIQAAGLDGEEELDTTVEQMGARYANMILRSGADGPYIIAGWSLGVILAYETAQQIIARGKEVSSLVVMDQGPSIPIDREPQDDAELLVDIFSSYFPLDAASLRQLEIDEQYRVVLRKAKKAGLVPHLVSLQNFKRYIRINKTQSHAWRTYTPKPYPGSLWLVRAKDSDAGEGQPADMGWGSLARGGVEIFETPGDHISMMQKPHVQVLADYVTRIAEEIPHAANLAAR